MVGRAVEIDRQAERRADGGDADIDAGGPAGGEHQRHDIVEAGYGVGRQGSVITHREMGERSRLVPRRTDIDVDEIDEVRLHRQQDRLVPRAGHRQPQPGGGAGEAGIDAMAGHRRERHSLLGSKDIRQGQRP